MSFVIGKYVRTLVLLISALSSPLACSGAMHSSSDDATIYSPLVTLSAGAAWINNRDTQTFFLQPELQKSYTADNDKKAFASGELFFAFQRILRAQFIAQAGLSVSTTSNATLSGDIWDDADPQFNNYSYEYKIKHSHLALKGKILLDKGFFVTPYVSASVGVGRNCADNFSIIPNNTGAVPAPAFLSHSNTSFIYTLGLGIQKALSTHCQAGIGYEFSDLGKSNLAAAPGQTINQGLQIKHLNTQQLQLFVTYTV